MVAVTVMGRLVVLLMRLVQVSMPPSGPLGVLVLALARAGVLARARQRAGRAARLAVLLLDAAIVEFNMTPRVVRLSSASAVRARLMRRSGSLVRSRVLSETLL